MALSQNPKQWEKDMKVIHNNGKKVTSKQSRMSYYNKIQFKKI